MAHVTYIQLIIFINFYISIILKSSFKLLIFLMKKKRKKKEKKCSK